MLRQLSHLSISASVLAILFTTGTSSAQMFKPSKQHLEESLENVAEGLSRLMSDQSVRALLAGQFSKRENRIALKDFLGNLTRSDSKKAEECLKIAASVSAVEAILEAHAVTPPRLEAKFPVREHIKLLTESRDLHVAIAPLADESEVRSVVAYSDGERISLSPDEPLKVPTLVIVPAEEESLDPPYPLKTADRPGKEEKEPKLDDYVGIPWIMIKDDHEGYFCGSPEIYVKIVRLRYSPFGVTSREVDLPGVNGERVWYFLGDPGSAGTNDTYTYVSTSNYAPVIQFQVWEADCGSHFSDDYLGTTTLYWTGGSLGFSGYLFQSFGDVEMYVDRD